MSTKQIVMFLGAPGSGKGALSRMCVDQLGWKQLSTGNLCRKHVSEGTELGKQIDFAMKSGTLVPDKVIIDIGTQWIGQEIDSAAGLILDGFPRTTVQAEGLLSFIKQMYPEVRLRIIKLQVPDSEIVERLSSRAVCPNKKCQAVFSTREESLMSKVAGICDYCGAGLVQREDDNPEVVLYRLKTYHQHAERLADFYRTAGFEVHEIDGMREVAKIFTDVLRYVS